MRFLCFPPAPIAAPPPAYALGLSATSRRLVHVPLVSQFRQRLLAQMMSFDYASCSAFTSCSNLCNSSCRAMKWGSVDAPLNSSDFFSTSMKFFLGARAFGCAGAAISLNLELRSRICCLRSFKCFVRSSVMIIFSSL